MCATVFLQAPAGANEMGLTTPRRSVQTFVKVHMAQEEQDALSDAITRIVGSIYDVVPAEVDVRLEGASDVKFSAETASVDEVLSVVDQTVEMAAGAEADVEALAIDVAAEHDPRNLPSGVEPDVVEDVQVSASSIEVTGDSSDGSLIVESETLVEKTYETGVVSKSLVETVAIFDAGGEVMSFKELTPEDYANQADVDSGTIAIPYEDGDLSSEHGEPLELSIGEGSHADPVSHTESPTRPMALADAYSGAISQVSFSSLTLPAKMSGANKKAAVAYAQKWALTRNPAYRKFDLNCTNFISQAMKAGGWKHDTGLWTSEKAWWYNSLNQSRPWVNAEDWFRFTRNHSQRGSVITHLGNVVPGDVIQIKFEGTTRIGHSMIVTKKVGTNVYVSYNTTDRLNKPLSEVIAAYSGETYFAHGI